LFLNRYTFTCIYVYIHFYIYTNTNIYIDTYIYIYIFTQININIYLNIGVYCSASGALLISASTVTLDGAGVPTSQWIFQTATSLVTATATSFILQNGAQAKNVYWAIGSSATIGNSSSFVGTILAQVSITYGISSTIMGRGLAKAAVSFEGKASMTLPSSPFPIFSILTQSPSTAPTNAPIVTEGSPTLSPTVVQIVSVLVTQSFTGISKDDSVSPALNTVLKNSIAQTVNIPSSAIEIISIISVNIDATRRSLLASGVDVTFTISRNNGDTKVITDKLNVAVSNGEMSNSIRLAGYPTANALAATVRVTSPTRSPSQAPTPGVIVINQISLSKDLDNIHNTDIIIGVIIGGFAFVLLVSLCYNYHCGRGQEEKYVRRNSVYVRNDKI
jgi:hypothetical protein